MMAAVEAMGWRDLVARYAFEGPGVPNYKALGFS